MSAVHFLYQFSLRFFLDIFHGIIQGNSNLTDVKDPNARLEVLFRDLFIVIYKRVSRTLLHEDRLTFSVRLALIKLKGGNVSVGDHKID